MPIPLEMSCGDSSTRARMRDEQGFGLVELLAAMMVLMIGILALFAMFESGIRQIKRASTVTTAGALADREMENFRAIRYDSIGLPDSLVVGRRGAVLVRSCVSGERREPRRAERLRNRALHDEGAGADADRRRRQELSGRHVCDLADDRGGARSEARHHRRPRRGRYLEGLGPDRVILRRVDRRVAMNGCGGGLRPRSGTCARELPERRRRAGARAALAPSPSVLVWKL